MKTFSIQTLGCKVNHYESEQIAALLDGIVRRQRRASREGFGESVTHGQFRVLRTLDHAEQPLRLSELAARLGIVPRSATSVVDDLEAAGLVARQPDPHDRRATQTPGRPAARRRRVDRTAGSSLPTHHRTR